MTEWQKIRLGEIVKTNQSTYSPKENWQFVNYLDTGNITVNKINEIQYIDSAKDKLPSRARRKVKTNSIIYSTVRPNQLHYGIIKEQPDNFLVSTGFAVIDVDCDKAVPDFIYYALTKQDVTEQLQAIAEQSVSAYPSIKPSDIENLEFTLPDGKTQERIVSILSTIDEKIKENNAINNNLEQQMQALFNEYLSSNKFYDLTTVKDVVLSANTGADAIQKAPMAMEFELIFKGDIALRYSDFLRDYEKTLSVMYQYQIIIKKINEENSKCPRSLEELSQRFSEKKYRDSLYEALDKLRESYDAVAQEKVEKKLRKQLVLI